MPNPDGTMTPDERKAALLGTAAPLAGAPGSGTQFTGTGLAQTQIANGQRLAGSQALNPGNNVQNELYGNLTDAEAQAKQQGDFGLGSNNNAATSAMLGNAQATGDKYSAAFGGDATAAGAASAAAGARGTAGYMGNTAPYSAAVGNAQQDRGLQTGAYDQLMNFAAQGPGPSAAQAQLTQATDANTQNALAMARSGRGMGGGEASMRQAIAQNAVTQQQAGGQMAELRANENTAFQGQRLNAMGAAGNLGTATVGADQGTAASGLAGAQYATNTKLQGTQLNDAASQAWAAQQQAAQQQGLGAEMGAQTQDLNINASALAGRESQWASANQTHGIDSGNATQAGIADANRTQAYVGAGASAAGGVISAVSDERYKTGITPLGGGVVAPLQNQAPAQSTSNVPIASQSAANAAQKSATDSAIGGTVGGAAGAVAGSAIAGPIGGIVGSVAGKALGKLFSDVRSKSNVQPLSAVGRGIQSAGTQLEGQKPRGAFGDLQALATKYGAGGVATSPRQATQYAALSPARAMRAGAAADASSKYAGQQRAGAAADTAGKYAGLMQAETSFAQQTRDDDQQQRAGAAADTWGGSQARVPLTKGDALLADSARNAPPSAYQYKDPADGQGTFVGPMAQDLATNPVTAPAVGADQNGKLSVDGGRAALAALSQNHSQQNQLDALYAMLDDSKKKELQRASGGLDSAGNPYMQAGAR